ncbi:hypothetical protein [Limoniibacter endophyticus]|uniref:Uncharacterized protein n=1 Tax=Limoniibacter endophyticus TaxID=1565040 RepID=A0A8J3DPF5_9HYPH|nr:hypothetical protein [Limoniibacter endophyticus]GHC63612.1 hypothetical protein GCM10010136_05080 [Limoniibacter endophyticus]
MGQSLLQNGLFQRGKVSFNQTMQAEADKARATMAKLMADIQGMASTVMAPTIRPKLDMSGISGVHADVGVE